MTEGKQYPYQPTRRHPEDGPSRLEVLQAQVDELSETVKLQGAEIERLDSGLGDITVGMQNLLAATEILIEKVRS